MRVSRIRLAVDFAADCSPRETRDMRCRVRAGIYFVPVPFSQSMLLPRHFMELAMRCLLTVSRIDTVIGSRYEPITKQ